MEPLGLDPGNYTGSYKLIGGRVCLDLVNTVSWPQTERRHDWLDSTNNASVWLEAAGLGVAEVTEPDLARFHRVREILTEVLRPLAQGHRPTEEAVERFNRQLRRALARRRIDPVALVWAWEPAKSAADLLHPVLLDAADLLADGDRSRLKLCPSCGWLFADQTRNGRRRWCDMADCGSRAKARRYYQRTRR